MSINPKDSEGARDRAAFQGADAAAAALGQTTGADALVGGRAKGWGVTPPGAPCDREGIRIETDPTPLERLPSGPTLTDDGTRLGDGNRMLYTSENAVARTNYDAAQHTAIDAAHVANLKQSGDGNGVTTVPRV